MKPEFVAGALASALGLIVATGCGPAETLFSSDGPDDGAGGSGAGAQGGSTSQGSSSGGSPSTSSSGGSPSTSSSSSSAGGAPTTSSGSAGAPPEMLDCGAGLECPVGEDSACCWDQWGQHGAPLAQCVSGDVPSDGCNTSSQLEIGNPGYETRIECQTSKHCEGGDMCCGHRRYSVVLQTSFYQEVVCTPEAECQAGEDTVVLCDTVGSTEGCPMLPTQTEPVQGVCQPSSLLPAGYLVCGYP
jgi:hypothetical protein